MIEIAPIWLRAIAFLRSEITIYGKIRVFPLVFNPKNSAFDARHSIRMIKKQFPGN